VTITLFKVFMPDAVMGPLRDVLLSGWIGEGPQVRLFERELADWFLTPHVLAVNSGTSALHLALRLAGAGPGDEVISTPMTCVATNTAIVALGASIVWADVDPWTGNISPDDVARKITARTRAVMAVHWGGVPCDLAGLSRAAGSLPIIEDAALAFGASWNGQRIGSISDFTCFSFQATKHLTTVDGGALTCRSPQAFERGRRLRWYGANRSDKPGSQWDQEIDEAGYKFHMNDVTAAIGLAQLQHTASILAAHRAHAAAYTRALDGHPAVRPLRVAQGAVGSFWTYTIRVANRASFAAHMLAGGIQTSRVFFRNDRYRAFAAARTSSLPGVDEFDAEQVSVPCGWWLSEEEVTHVIERMLSFRGS